MVDRNTPSAAAVNAVTERIDRQGVRATARELGIDRATIHRVASGLPVSARTMVALAKIAPRVRKAAEFKGTTTVQPPLPKESIYSWSLEMIRRARDNQMAGNFELPVRLAEALRTDSALFNAYRNRIAPQTSVEKKLEPHDSSRGKSVAAKALVSCFVAESVLTGIHGTLANHGIAIGHIERETNEDGTRVDFKLTEWPLEHVRWRPSERALYTAVKDANPVPINHGDGEWVVFRKFHFKPWTQEACLLPAALVWPGLANAIRDWAQASLSHGQAKVMGELAEGVALADENGDPSPEMRLYLETMQSLFAGESIVGVQPHGAKTVVLANGSTAWQVFSEFSVNREKAATRIYLGTDAILGTMSGAPGVDIASLFGISTTILQSDLRVIQQALRTGLYEPWTAVNFGDSQYAPTLVYQLADPDAEAKKKELADQEEQERKKLNDLLDLIDRYRKSGMIVTQVEIDEIAAELGVCPVPQLAPAAEAAVPLALAPTDLAKVVRVDEARKSQGLPAIGDDRGKLTLPELDARAQGAADAAVKAAPAAPAPPTPAAP